MRDQGILADHAAETRFVEEVFRKAAGNLGYVGAVGRAFDIALKTPQRQTAMDSLLKLTELPPTLEDLYGFFFNQIKAQVAGQGVEVEDPSSGAAQFLPAWPAVYQKALAVLSVAYEALTVGQVADLGQIPADRGYVVSALENL